MWFTCFTVKCCDISLFQGTYRWAKICFLFGKYGSLRSEICTEVSFNTTFTLMQTFLDSRWICKSFKTFSDSVQLAYYKLFRIGFKVWWKRNKLDPQFITEKFLRFIWKQKFYNTFSNVNSFCYIFENMMGLFCTNVYK